MLKRYQGGEKKLKRVKVQKKDGRIEDFNPEKLTRSILAAGASDSQAKLITKEVEEWLYNIALGEIVNSQEIRQKVISSLKEKNPGATQAYQSYQKQV